MSVKGLVTLLFCVLLVSSGVWLTLDQARQERQWNLERDAASGVFAGEMPGDEVNAGTGESRRDHQDGIVSMLP